MMIVIVLLYYSEKAVMFCYTYEMADIIAHRSMQIVAHSNLLPYLLPSFLPVISYHTIDDGPHG